MLTADKLCNARRFPNQANIFMKSLIFWFGHSNKQMIFIWPNSPSKVISNFWCVSLHTKICVASVRSLLRNIYSESRGVVCFQLRYLVKSFVFLVFVRINCIINSALGAWLQFRYVHHIECDNILALLFQCITIEITTTTSNDDLRVQSRDNAS